MNTDEKILSLVSRREDKKKEADRECMRDFLMNIRELRKLRPDMCWYTVVAGNATGQYNSALFVGDESGINPLSLPEIVKSIINNDLL
jgi:hypothetical protein